MTDPSLVSLLDDYAMNSMLALMQVYAPEEWPEDEDEAAKWCDWISARSYLMAASMMNARHHFHVVLAEAQKEKQENANA